MKSALDHMTQTLEYQVKVKWQHQQKGSFPALQDCITI